MSAREDILGRLGGPAPASEATADVHADAPRPATSWAERAVRFTANAEAAAATVARVGNVAAIGDAVAGYLRERGLPLAVHLSASPPGLAPGSAGGLTCSDEPPAVDGATLVTGCLAAVAEEGVVVLASGTDHAAESAFLAATHVVVVEPAQLVDSLESLWVRLRDEGSTPRMLNIIRGPSRTADLGVPSRLGAHGPLRVHVVLAGDSGPN
jgi:L-lactate dehydrogenase complex protein LldG